MLHVRCALSLQSPAPLQPYSQSCKGHHSSPRNTFIDLLFLQNLSASSTWQVFSDVFSVTKYRHNTLAWLRNAGSRICTKAKQGSPLSVVDITAFVCYICAKSAFTPYSFADLKCFSDASKPLIIQCEHYILQTVLTHTLIRLSKHSSYLLLTTHYIEYT